MARRAALTAEDVQLLTDAGDEGLFSDAFKGKRIVCTGTMSMPRADIRCVIEAAGGIPVDRAARGVDFLVCGDTGAHGMTAKIKTALELGLEVLEEHEFANMLLSPDVVS